MICYTHYHGKSRRDRVCGMQVSRTGEDCAEHSVQSAEAEKIIPMRAERSVVMYSFGQRILWFLSLRPIVVVACVCCRVPVRDSAGIQEKPSGEAKTRQFKLLLKFRTTVLVVEKREGTVLKVIFDGRGNLKPPKLNPVPLADRDTLRVDGTRPAQARRRQRHSTRRSDRLIFSACQSVCRTCSLIE